MHLWGAVKWWIWNYCCYLRLTTMKSTTIGIGYHYETDWFLYHHSMFYKSHSNFSRSMYRRTDGMLPMLNCLVFEPNSDLWLCYVYWYDNTKLSVRTKHMILTTPNVYQQASEPWKLTGDWPLQTIPSWPVILTRHPQINNIILL